MENACNKFTAADQSTPNIVGPDKSKIVEAEDTIYQQGDCQQAQKILKMFEEENENSISERVTTILEYEN